jgi:hypothetical protein
MKAGNPRVPDSLVPARLKLEPTRLEGNKSGDNNGRALIRRSARIEVAD